jgi:hypothetical protein
VSLCLRVSPIPANQHSFRRRDAVWESISVEALKRLANGDRRKRVHHRDTEVTEKTKKSVSSRVCLSVCSASEDGAWYAPYKTPDLGSLVYQLDTWSYDMLTNKPGYWPRISGHTVGIAKFVQHQKT